MHHPSPAWLAASLLLLATGPALAQSTKPATEQVIVPQVDRRDVRAPRLPSNDFSFGLMIGSYATQNFGTSAVKGVRLGYHITEDVFVEGVYAITKVSDKLFRDVLPAGIIPPGQDKLKYYNVSAGYNLLPGEVFFGRNNAKAMQGYVIGGIGSTRFAGQTKQTINAGFGLRLFLADWFALQADVRDHLFSLDLLGQRKSTQNVEVTFGLTAFF
jgi:outer membrane beta-barrel protein